MKTLILVNSKDLVSLANSVHAVTLLELNVTLNDITSGWWTHNFMSQLDKYQRILFI